MTVVYIDFHGGSSSAAAPWSYNSFTSFGVGNLTSDLKDDSNASTGYSLDIINAFTGATGSGATATAGAGGWPEEVFEFYFYTGASESPSKLRLGNLTNGDNYTVEVAGHAADPVRDTDFTVGATTLTYDNAGTGVPASPISFSGTISGTSLDIDASLISSFGYINGLKITITPAASGPTIDSSPTSISPTESFSFTVSGPATAPTTGNTTGGFTGLTGIAPDSVTGSDPYTITWTLPRTTAKLFDATGYVFDITIDVESVSSSAIPYAPPSGSDYIDVGTIDTGAQAYTDYTGGTFVSTDQLVWDNSPSLSFTDDLNYVVTGPLSATVYRIAAAGTVDIENTMSFTLGNDGIVTAVVSPMVSNIVSNMVN